VFRTEKDSRLAIPRYDGIVAHCRDDDDRADVGLFVKDIINFKIREDLSVFTLHVCESIMHRTKKNKYNCWCDLEA
jgi:hypothetical protein